MTNDAYAVGRVLGRLPDGVHLAADVRAAAGRGLSGLDLWRIVSRAGDELARGALAVAGRRVVITYRVADADHPSRFEVRRP